MDPSRNPPKLSKQPSNPISIGGGRAAATGAHAQPRPQTRPVSHSMPSMRYVPPPPPSNRPKVPDCEPPPIELPPSPPMYNDIDVRQQMELGVPQAAVNQMAPLSRSLNDYSTMMLSSSAPAHHTAWQTFGTSPSPFGTSPSQTLNPLMAGSKNFTPAFGALLENTEEEEHKLTATTGSFSEPPTIISMLRASSSHPSPAAPIFAALSSTPDRSSFQPTSVVGFVPPAATVTGFHPTPSGGPIKAGVPIAAPGGARGRNAGPSSHQHHQSRQQQGQHDPTMAPLGSSFSDPAAADDMFQFSLSLDPAADSYIDEDIDPNHKYSLQYHNE